MQAPRCPPRSERSRRASEHSRPHPATGSARCKETHDEEQNDRADECNNQAADQSVAERNSARAKQIDAEKYADDTYDNVTEETETRCLHEQDGKSDYHHEDDYDQKQAHS